MILIYRLEAVYCGIYRRKLLTIQQTYGVGSRIIGDLEEDVFLYFIHGPECWLRPDRPR